MEVSPFAGSGEMKKKHKYSVISSVMYVNEQGLVAAKEEV
jgi:hypothetical protein